MPDVTQFSYTNRNCNQVLRTNEWFEFSDHVLNIDSQYNVYVDKTKRYGHTCIFKLQQMNGVK